MKSQKASGYIAIIICFFAVMLLASCGGEEKTGPEEDITIYLPTDLKGMDLKRAQDIKIYEGQSLYEYIDGGAELYHEYGFARVATVPYKDSSHEIVLDIYEFDSPENAYGLYTRIRSDRPDIVNLGAEGFRGEGTLDFVKGKYLARLTAFDASPGTKKLEQEMAAGLDSILPGTKSKPQEFGVFPDTNKIPFSEKMYASAYLGQSFLTQVYVQDYSMAEDTVTLFFSSDPNGVKYLQWSQLVDNDEERSGRLQGLAFDGGSVLLMPDDYYGDIVAGLRAGHLVGMVNYSEEYLEFFSNWLNSIK